MAGITASPETHNPLLVNYFEFVLDRVPNMTFFCQSANLPGLGMGVVQQETPFAYPINVPSGAIRFEELTLSFKVDENLTNWLELYNWIKRSSNYAIDCQDSANRYTTYSQKTESNGSLLITNSSYKPKIKINFLNLFPTSLSGIQFSVALPDSFEAIATVKFIFTSYKIEKLVNS